MLYTVLRFLMKLTGRVFFKSITIQNRDLIPSKGPLMVLANHPSTFMDPIVITTMLDREVYFLAKGELFRNKVAAWLFAQMNMIPVYRKQDDPNQMSKNEETFSKCYEHLEKGGAILMFPEGTSITERKLRTIKTGASRIVLGAEERNRFKLNTRIINIGLNYENPHKFNRELYINIATPLKGEDYQEAYLKDSFGGAQKLTEDIRQQLEGLIIGINDAQTDTLVNDVALIYKQKLWKDLGIKGNDKEAEFTITKNIVDVVNYFLLNDPINSEKLKIRIKSYLNKIAELGLSYSDFEVKKVKSVLVSGIKNFLIVVLGLPVYLYGLINNILAFEIPSIIAKKVTKGIEYRGALGMVLGMISFLIFYAVQVKWVYDFTHSFNRALIYLISLPLSGAFAYWYYHMLKRIRAKWILMLIFYKKSNLIAGLITEREHIIAEFDKLKLRYENRNKPLL